MKEPLFFQLYGGAAAFLLLGNYRSINCARKDQFVPSMTGFMHGTTGFMHEKEEI